MDGGIDAITYSLHAMVPEAAEQALAGWVAGTSGASLSPWGSHMTVIGRFPLMEDADALPALMGAIEESCGATEPFAIRLNKTAVRRHRYESSRMIVMLECDGRTDDFDRFVQYRAGLASRLASLIGPTDIRLLEEEYVPHVSLTTGIDERTARRVARSAEAAKVDIRFMLSRIWLYRHEKTTTGQLGTTPVQAFRLGAKP
ncbi:2'-5' RNA ligase family protein [Paenibacillus sp. GYB003]|uniref:2'-5' RNA ligase family protein n=1 Tax=Paenibacillus sp. GYB003 TaxID=2994392 RepID=UPI002F96CA8B